MRYVFSIHRHICNHLKRLEVFFVSCKSMLWILGKYTGLLESIGTNNLTMTKGVLYLPYNNWAVLQVTWPCDIFDSIFCLQKRRFARSWKSQQWHWLSELELGIVPTICMGHHYTSFDQRCAQFGESFVFLGPFPVRDHVYTVGASAHIARSLGWHPLFYSTAMGQNILAAGEHCFNWITTDRYEKKIAISDLINYSIQKKKIRKEKSLYN